MPCAAFGAARFYGDMAGRTAARVVASAPTPSGHGYWLAAADGSVYAFGDARFAGSMYGRALNSPIVGMAATPTGRGYYLLGRDGGIFTFGDARFYGSTGDRRLNAPVLDMTATPDGHGYWMVAGDGGIFTFGNASFHGSTGAHAPQLSRDVDDRGRQRRRLLDRCVRRRHLHLWRAVRRQRAEPRYPVGASVCASARCRADAGT